MNYYNCSNNWKNVPDKRKRKKFKMAEYLASIFGTEKDKVMFFLSLYLSTYPFIFHHSYLSNNVVLTSSIHLLILRWFLEAKGILLNWKAAFYIGMNNEVGTKLGQSCIFCFQVFYDKLHVQHRIDKRFSIFPVCIVICGMVNSQNVFKK